MTARALRALFRAETLTLLFSLAVVYGMLSISTSPLAALTISPELREQLQAEGKWPEFSRKFSDWHRRLDSQQSPLNLNSRRIAKAAAGQAAVPETLRVCVLLVDFSDNPASGGSVSNVTPELVRQILFAPGGNGYGSLSDFYSENSYGQLQIVGDVYGWFRMPKSYAVYVGGDNGLQSTEPNAQTLAKDAMLTADPSVNFAPYDNDGDGYIEGLFIVHAGPGAEENGQTTHIWSHRWNMGGQVLSNEGARGFNYVAVPEEVLGGPPRIGVYTHEFGHVLGLPDLYDIGPDPSQPGLGRWSLMAGGSWNFGQRKPANFDAWSKHVLDSLHGTFGRTVDVTANLRDVVLHSAVADSVRYRIKVPSATNCEYFMIENRQQEGFDQYLPGAGLLIYHCDDFLAGSNNTVRYPHLRVSLEQADGFLQLEQDINEGDGDDPFPGVLGEMTEFTSLSSPNTASWYNTPHQISVWGIRRDPAAKTITCNLDVAFSRTYLEIVSLEFTDQLSGNGNGKFEPGEIVQARLTLKNHWQSAGNVTATLATATTGISFLSPTAQFPVIGSGQEVVSTIPFAFVLDQNITPVIAQFDLSVVSQVPPDTFALNVQQPVGGVDILLVDADDSPQSTDVVTFYTIALDSLMVPYEYWDVAAQGIPAASQNPYKIIIWFTGSMRPDLTQTISSAEVAFLREYVDQGGHLFLTGQDIAERLALTADSTFLRDYLGARYLGDMRPYEADGVAGSSITSGLKLRVAGSVGASNQLDADLIDVLPGSEPVITLKTFGATETGLGGTVTQLPNNAVAVFFSFGAEAITTSQGALGFATRTEVLRRVINYLRNNVATDAGEIVDVRPLPFDFALEQNYPNPFNPSTVISFTVSPRVAGAPLTLEVFNILGQRVALHADAPAQPGTNRIDFDAAALASGVYFYRLRVGEQSQTRKMILSK